MKKRIALLTITLLLFNSCIIKSLHPFYTKKTISFQKDFIGYWRSGDKEKWKIISFKKKYLKDNQTNDPLQLSKDKLKIYDTYKDAYFVDYINDNKKAVFIAVPFKINKQLFLDFILYEIDENEINDLALLHLTFAHSIAKFDIISKNNISISWLDEDKIRKLLDRNKIKINYEKIGPDNQYILTASSEELQKFIKKYIASKESDKWSIEVKLTRINE